MTLSSREIEVRRCRPLLGTFVEIAARGASPAAMQRAIHAAFAAVQRVQDLMSAHEPTSELSRLNREAARREVAVSVETFTVLQRGLRLAEESDGAFDFTVAPLLARWGMLPERLRQPRSGNWRDLRLRHGRRVFFVKPLALDLGGIAKGFAVDLAIQVLRDEQATSALVNAGGDLRVFGTGGREIHLRHPASGAVLSRSIELRNSALATSSPCFTEICKRGRKFSHLVDTRTKRAITGACSVTVRAPECWLADALTKVVLVDPTRASRLLAKFQAEAFLLAA
jgi:thiamine biosynthesis lipoprotein